MQTYTINYTGKGISLNQAYTLHWTKAKKLKDELKHQFSTLLLSANVPTLKAFRIKLIYNSRLDIDNTVATTKVFVDTMRHLNMIKDDTKDIFKGLSIEADTTLKKNTYQITIISLE